jgi:nitric oxide reductase large subunit
MDNGISGIIFVIAMILFIVFTVLATQVPKLSEGDVSAVLLWIAIITLLAGIITFSSIGYMMPGYNDMTTLLYWLVFVIHIFLFPLTLFGALASAVSVHDAKKSLLSQQNT